MTKPPPATITLDEQDRADIGDAIGAYISDYEGAVPDSKIERMRALGKRVEVAKPDQIREAAVALLDSLPYHTPECPYCPGRVMATKVATLKHPLAGVRFTCDAHVQDGDEARDLETSAQVRALRALIGVKS